MSDSTNEQKLIQIADSVHRYITIPSHFYISLIDTPEFQRLRRIGQLGGVSISYPSATHSRFAHSLGAFHIANRIITSLRDKHPDFVSQRDIDYVRISALIHDIGHGPFSHMFEDVFSKFCIEEKCFKKFSDFTKHENITEQIVLSDETPIGYILSQAGYDKRKIADLIIGKQIEGKTFLNQIISSQLDGDSIDYLMRDSLETGVSFGLYNIERLLAMLKISDGGQIVVKEKGLQNTEQLVLARYMQFARVYFHKTVRCWEFMMKSYISELLKALEMDKKNLTVLPFITDFSINPSWKTLVPLTDDTFHTQLQLSAYKEQKNSALHQLAKRIVKRDLFKSIPLTEEMANNLEEDRDKIDRIMEQLGYPLSFWGIDRFSSRYYTPYEEIHRDAILIERKDGRIQQLSEVSDVVNSLTKPRYNSLLICPKECKDKIFEKNLLS